MTNCAAFGDEKVNRNVQNVFPIRKRRPRAVRCLCPLCTCVRLVHCIDPRDRDVKSRGRQWGITAVVLCFRNFQCRRNGARSKNSHNFVTATSYVDTAPSAMHRMGPILRRNGTGEAVPNLYTVRYNMLWKCFHYGRHRI